jgi:hypothetical protein
MPINTRDFNAMAKALRESKPLLAKELKKSLRRAGEITAAEARAISSTHSTSIPPSVKTHVRGAVVEVRAGGAGVPIAGLYEYGNRGSSSGNTFRHPVFGDRSNWVQQKRYPFMRPAVLATGHLAETEILKALDAVSRKMVS